MSNERLERGIKKINELVEGGEKGVMKGLGEVAPDLANYVLKFIFGDLYSRKGLDIKIKQIITITSLAVLGNAKPQLAYHINLWFEFWINQRRNYRYFNPYCWLCWFSCCTKWSSHSKRSI
jgi:4-carboxymuconolactone decarboxylase